MTKFVGREFAAYKAVIICRPLQRAYTPLVTRDRSVFITHQKLAKMSYEKKKTISQLRFVIFVYLVRDSVRGNLRFDEFENCRWHLPVREEGRP